MQHFILFICFEHLMFYLFIYFILPLGLKGDFLKNTVIYKLQQGEKHFLKVFQKELMT